MSRSERRIGVALAVTLVLVTAGCLGSTGSDDTSLVVRQVDSVPAEVPVTSLDNDTVQSSTTLADAVAEVASSEDSEVTVRLSDDEVEEVRRVISSLPTYDGDQAGSGTYVETGDTVVVVQLQKQQ